MTSPPSTSSLYSNSNFNNGVNSIIGNNNSNSNSSNNINNKLLLQADNSKDHPPQRTSSSSSSSSSSSFSWFFQEYQIARKAFHFGIGFFILFWWSFRPNMTFVALDLALVLAFLLIVELLRPRWKALNSLFYKVAGSDQNPPAPPLPSHICSKFCFFFPPYFFNLFEPI